MDERYRTGETNMFLLEFRIKDFWGPKALQWGGMIQGVIRHESYTDPNKGKKWYNASKVAMHTWFY